MPEVNTPPCNYFNVVALSDCMLVWEAQKSHIFGMNVGCRQKKKAHEGLHLPTDPCSWIQLLFEQPWIIFRHTQYFHQISIWHFSRFTGFLRFLSTVSDSLGKKQSCFSFTKNQTTKGCKGLYSQSWNLALISHVWLICS